MRIDLGTSGAENVPDPGCLQGESALQLLAGVTSNSRVRPRWFPKASGARHEAPKPRTGSALPCASSQVRTTNGLAGILMQRRAMLEEGNASRLALAPGCMNL
jgi:hypothetical protein